MDFLKLLDLKAILLVVLGLVIVFLYLHKENQIGLLKDEKISIQEDLIKEKNKSEQCNNKLQEQNKEIEEMRVEVTYQEPKLVERIKNIYIKDSSCEAELKAYKELFQ